MVVKSAQKTNYKLRLGLQKNISILMSNTCFFVKTYLSLSFAARACSAKSPYASEGKIDMFGSQKHVFFKNLFRIHIFLMKTVFSEHV